MPLPRFSRGFGLTLLGMALLPGLSYVALSVATTPPPIGVRVPALDGMATPIAWIDPTRVLAAQWTKTVTLDLKTGRQTPFPAFGRVSPDRTWVLAGETYHDQPTEHLSLYPLTNAPTPWSVTASRPIPTAKVWLPDSSGWVEQQPDASRTTTLVRFRLAAPERPEPALPPGALPILPDGRTWLRRARPDGSFLIQTSDKHGKVDLMLVGPNAGPPRPVSFPGATGSDLTNAATDNLSSHGDALVVLRPVAEPRWTRWLRALWLRPAPDPRTEFLRLHADGTPPERLAVIDTDGVFAFSVAPDGKALVYWQVDDAYYLPLP